MKPQRVHHILVVVLLILSGNVLCQQVLPRPGQISPHFQAFRAQSGTPGVQLTPRPEAEGHFLVPGPHDTVFSSNSLGFHPLPTAFGVRNLPFFCGQEYRFEKATSLPLRVRLGSLDYVNHLEGKRQ
jgi:hypothetical protein